MEIEKIDNKIENYIFESSYKELEEIRRDENKSVVARVKKRVENGNFLSVISVLGPDWEGFIDSVTGILHARGVNLDFVVSFRVEKNNLGFVEVKIRHRNEDEFNWWSKNAKKIENDIEIACMKDNLKKEMLRESIVQIENYEKIKRQIITKFKDENIDNLLKSIGFFVKYYSRIKEKDINYMVKLFSIFHVLYKKLKKRINVDVKMSSINSTLIIGICSKTFIPADKIFYMVQSLLPDIQKHYYSEYAIGEGYIYIVEIPAQGKMTDEERKVLVNESLSYLKQGEIDIDAYLSEEEFYKTVIPQMLNDFERYPVPHLYIQYLPGGRSRMRVTLITEQISREKNLGIEMAERISTRGIKVLSVEKPSFIKRKDKTYELNNVYITFRASIFGNTYNVQKYIKEKIEKLVGTVRDYAGTFSLIFDTKFKKLMEETKSKNREFLKLFFFKVIDNRTKIEMDVEFLKDYYKLFIKAINKFREKNVSIIKTDHIKDELVLVTVSYEPDYFEKCLGHLSKFKTISHRVDIENFTVGMFRIPTTKFHTLNLRKKLRRILKRCIETK